MKLLRLLYIWKSPLIILFLVFTLIISTAVLPVPAAEISAANPNPSGSTITVTGNDTNSANPFTNNGNIQITGSLTNNGSLVNNNAINISSQGTFTQGATGNYTGAGTITLDGTLTSNQASGSFIVNTLAVSSGETGLLTGTGTSAVTTGNVNGTLNYTGTGNLSLTTLNLTNYIGYIGTFNNNGNGNVYIATVAVESGNSGHIGGSGPVSLTTANVDGTLQVSSVISGVGFLIKTGGGSLVLRGANTYSGGTTVNAGGLLGDATSLQGNIINNGRVIFSQESAGTYAGTMSGIGSLDVYGDLTLSGTNTYSGGTIIPDGTVRVSSDSNLGDAAGALTLGSTWEGGGLGFHGTLQVTSGFTSTRPVTLEHGGNFDTNGNDLTLAGSITGTGSLTKLGAGTLILSGINTYSGGTTVSAGILQGNTSSLQGNIINNSQVIFNQGSAGTYAGNMSGTGYLVKEGTGTLTLSGNNTYSGGTTVNAGILQGNTSSLQGNITNNNQVTFNQESAGTYAGNMSGSGCLVKEGTGTLTLSGNNTYSGGTLINNGSISINGNMTSPITIGTTGMLKGIGNITGNISNFGTLAPGNSIGTTTITGNYTHNAGAIYQLEVNPAGQSDKLVVTGTATLNGGTVSVLAETGNYNMTTNYTILTAGNVAGTFANVTSNLAFLTPSLSYDSTNVYLLLTRNTTNFTAVATTPNQTSVATAFDRIAPMITGDMTTVMNSLLNLSASSAGYAYAQTGGFTHMAVTEASFFAFNRYLGIISDRIESSFIVDTASSFAGKSLWASLGNTATDANPFTPKNKSLWMKLYGSTGDRKGNDMSSKYGYSALGIIFGYDQKIHDSLLLGICTGYSAAGINMDEMNETGKISGYQASLYMSYLPAPWYINGVVAYGYSLYDTSRKITFDNINRTASADYTGHAITGYVDAGYNLPIKSVCITPFASLQASYLTHNGFMEKGAGDLNLNVGTEHTKSLLNSLGVGVKKGYSTTFGVITPELKIRWLHEFADNDYSSNASFIRYPASSFTVKTDAAPRDSAAISLGMAWTIRDNLDIALTYESTTSGDRMQNAGSLWLRYIW